MDGNQGLQDVERRIHGFPISEVLLAVRVGVKGFAVNVFGDQVPVASIGLTRPETSTTCGW